MNFKQKKTILIILKLVSSIALILWVIRKTQLSEVIQALKEANIYFLLGAFVLYSGSYYLRTYRWQILLKTKGIKASNIYLYQSYIVGIFFSNFLPSIVGGDAVRIYDIWRLEPNKSISVSTVIVDRILGLLVLIAFAGGVLLFTPQVSSLLNPYYSYLWLLLGIVIVAVVFKKTFSPLRRLSYVLHKIELPWWQKIKTKITNVLEAFISFSNHKFSLIKALAWSILVQIAVIAHYYLIAKALNFPTSFAIFFLVVPIATVIMMLPISINGIGLRENAFIFLLGILSPGTSRPDTIAFSWLAYGIIVILGLIGGIVHMLRKYSHST
ncbi:MAG: lysylphosphatidylglycerol synthase transmembrane domain-containing protein [Pleurocapsa sp. MO_226.B13]|nr:lysylphosphatidylglycerol synthase transmembrane domain-containing protein [Pleurocapsa sp. MO_226.B13]